MGRFEDKKEKNEDFYEKKRPNPCGIKNKSYLCIRNRKGEAQTIQKDIKNRDVAQLASAPRSGRGGRKFESSHPDKRQMKYFICRFFFAQSSHPPKQGSFHINNSNTIQSMNL